MIKERIKNITEMNGNSIIVLKGFNTNKLSKESKYFSFNINYYDKVNLTKIYKQVADDILQNRTFDNTFKWMTIEEYLLFKKYEVLSEMPIFILENNLYDKQFPYRNTLSDIDNIYHDLYYKEDNELGDEQKELLNRVSFFYGKIEYSKDSERFYVTYPELDTNIKVYDYYEGVKSIDVKFSDNVSVESEKQLELSDYELPFLDMELEILKNSNTKPVILTLSGSSDRLPYKYLKRLKILSQIRNTKFIFKTLSTRRQFIDKEACYLNILKNIFGYERFREIDFYKNIEEHSKETTKISQAQIIDDIVTQAEKSINGYPFRDIYITASTGAGKSIMFQIPALFLAHKYVKNKPLTLVISPLIGLMNDQVAAMHKKGIDSSATINGNTPQFEKEQILEKIQNQEIDILYLSPETLQARSDIKMLIGDRKIGIVIVDEAHIVTTWGKSFRADYWYLGIYLAKLRKEYRFPIVTFTATAIYGGREDMYLDTRNSLSLINPISYFGKVRRDDIYMNVRSSEKDLDAEGRDYRKTKNALALRHLKRAYKEKQKSLIYFPTVKLLLDFYDFEDLNCPEIAKETGKFYGTLQKEEKDDVLSKFKSGELRFVLATKAFGMGIDIPDITNVYHYAPTGSVVDYVQEIGRATRDKSKVPYGFGLIDFLPKDMNDVKRLYGMSAIRKSQIIEVMQKVLSVYKEKHNNRNLLISPEDFKYIFVQNKHDEDSLDNKVKTVLLMIEKDFASPNKLGYSPFVARPRSVFGNDLIFVTQKLENQFIHSRLGKYFSLQFKIQSSKYSSVYQVNLSKIWEKYYKRMSFPSFKYSLNSKKEIENLQHKNLFKKFKYTSGIQVSTNDNYSTDDIIAKYKQVLSSFEEFISSNKISKREFNIIDLGNHFKKSMKIADKYEARALAQTIINSAFEFCRIKKFKFITERQKLSSNNSSYKIYGDADIFSDFILNSLIETIYPKDNYFIKGNEIYSFYCRNDSEKIDSKIAALGIGENQKFLHYQLIGGSNPQIYVRINSIAPLEKAIKQGNLYQNSILQDVLLEQETSVKMLKYLFTQNQFSKLNTEDRILKYFKWFWDNIENYFMGVLPDDI